MGLKRKRQQTGQVLMMMLISAEALLSPAFEPTPIEVPPTKIFQSRAARLAPWSLQQRAVECLYELSYLPLAPSEMPMPSVKMLSARCC